MPRRKKVAPKHVRVELTGFVRNGLLLAVNERVLWPLGMALTYHEDPRTGECYGLYVSEWEAGGRVEAIEMTKEDLAERRKAFAEWVERRLAQMPIDGERERAAIAALLPKWVVPQDREPIEAFDDD